MNADNSVPVRRREIFGWCCFDFANSAYTTIIITVIYSVYFAKVVAGGSPRAAAWWGITLALAQLAVLLVSPLIGAITDIRANKKTFLAVTAALCSVCTLGLFFVGPGEIWFALILVGLGTVAFYLSENICAGFLPEISTPENAGRISGYGWSFGYFGGLLSLVLALFMTDFGRAPENTPATFVMTGLFFALAALPTLLLLRERATPRPLPPGTNLIKAGWGENLRSLATLREHRTLAIFFLSLFFSTAGLTAVVAFASLFASEVLHLTQSESITLFIVLQLAGVAGAWGFGILQDRAGPKPALALSLALWIAVCVAAAYCPNKTWFYVVGAGAGIALGAFQSGGRAVVALFTPPGKSGEYFGFWGFFGKLAGVVGQPVFGLLAAWLGYRAAILANAGFFLVGLLILLPLSMRPSPISPMHED
jgi:UMF1 family MFS transporter